jgi:hypothetical protein
VDWGKLKREYIKGGTSYRKLSEKYGVPFGTLKRHALEEGWGKLRAKAEQKADTKLIEAVSDKNAAITNNIYATADKLLEKLTEALEMITPEEILIDKKGFRSLTGALNDIKDIKDIRSDRDLREQEARIAKLIKDAEPDSDANKVITISIEGGAKEYGE